MQNYLVSRVNWGYGPTDWEIGIQIESRQDNVNGMDYYVARG